MINSSYAVLVTAFEPPKLALPKSVEATAFNITLKDKLIKFSELLPLNVSGQRAFKVKCLRRRQGNAEVQVAEEEKVRCGVDSSWFFGFFRDWREEECANNMMVVRDSLSELVSVGGKVGTHEPVDTSSWSMKCSFKS